MAKKYSTVAAPLKDQKPDHLGNPLNNKEREWIEENAKSMSVMEMMKVLLRSPSLIYDFMDEKGIVPLSRNKNKVSRKIRPPARKGYFDEKAYAKSSFI